MTWILGYFKSSFNAWLMKPVYQASIVVLIIIIIILAYKLNQKNGGSSS